MSRVRELTLEEARAFLRRAHRIDRRLAGVDAALRHLGYVQIDPINVCGRMHDHILRLRVEDYREGDLFRYLHGDGTALGPESRRAFEHHLPVPNRGILVAFPLEAWPHLHKEMRRRSRTPGAWSGKLTPREKEMAGHVLERIAAEGPKSSEAFADTRKGRKVWGAATLGKATLQKLFFQGRLLISGREKNRRIYDLPERVLPSSALALPEASEKETCRWLATLRLKQLRLVSLNKRELELVEGLVEPVRVDRGPVVHILKEDAALLDAAGAGERPTDVQLLAPLDPMIYDRPMTRRVWAFDYIWEAYTPERLRKRGYYALPVLSGTEIVGHVDLKADRSQGRLSVVSRKVRRGHASMDAVGRLERFLGLEAR